jgi:hypothetical protein
MVLRRLDSVQTSKNSFILRVHDMTPNLSKVAKQRLYKHDTQNINPEKIVIPKHGLLTRRSFKSINELKLPKRNSYYFIYLASSDKPELVSVRSIKDNIFNTKLNMLLHMNAPHNCEDKGTKHNRF